MDLRKTIERLAFQVDRKILHADDEDHIRMDISAHEKLKPFKERKIKEQRLPFPGIRRFALSTVTIFIGLFFITNMSAYSQIFMANLNDYLQEREDTKIEESAGEMSMSTGQTSDQSSNSGTAILKETEDDSSQEEVQAALLPDNGILPISLTPTTYDNQIRIPSIQVDSLIVEPELGVEALLSQDWNELEDQIRSSLLQGVVHYPGTAEAGQKGNFFLTGHSSNVFWEPSPYNTIFALLPKIEVGADIYITYGQNEFHYRVTETKEVTPKDVSILKQGENHKMTIVTCTPVGTTLRRFVVVAELIK